MKTCKCNREELDIVVLPNIILKIEECGTSNSNLENSIILELHKKQDKEDEGLITTSNNVVGAINEIKQKALDDYGPYENTALEEIATMLYDRLTPGKTIGVIEDDKVVEYWWQPVDGGYGFVKKVDTGTPVVYQTESEVTIQPNVMNVWTNSVSNLTVKKGDVSEGIVNNYMIRFTTGNETVVIFEGIDVKWYGGDVPTWTAGNTYEISIVDNIALWAEFEPTV